MLPKMDFRSNKKIVCIGGLHTVGLLYGLFGAIYNIMEDERAVTDSDILYIALHISLHVFLITTLIMGASMQIALFLLPWLIVSFPIFTSVSYYTMKYSRFTYPSQLIVNVCFICFAWYLWYTVFKCFHSCVKIRRKYEKNDF